MNAPLRRQIVLSNGTVLNTDPARVRFPTDSQRHVIIGRTGSGKTQAACYALSRRSFDVKPWIIFDFKGDSLIAAMDPIELDVRKVKLPEKAGLYVIRAIPKMHDAYIEKWLWEIWRGEGVGIYIDEGYMISDEGAFQAILTQGRSKEIPVICLSQRPKWMNRFVWSEADFIQAFSLNDRGDRKAVSEFTTIPSDYHLHEFFSYYFDVGSNTLTRFSPVPDAESILATVRERLPKKAKKL